ncbi:hypothetical protein GJ496_004245 [Pomphorhynchus laevis]|nr:hypothetical protein GJ496_004245 [Pomphorhynchus laevis]
MIAQCFVKNYGRGDRYSTEEIVGNYVNLIKIGFILVVPLNCYRDYNKTNISHIKSVLPTIDDNSTKLDATTVTDRISVSIMPLPQSVIDLLNDNSQSLFSPGPELRNKLAEKLAEHCAKKSKQYINTFLDSILSFGSSSPGLSNVSSNILVSRDPQSFVAGIPPSMMDDGTTTNMTFDCHDELQNTSRSMLTKILEALVHGFQLSLHRGPLCSEPIVGVCVLIDWIDDIFDLSKSSYSATFDVVSTRSSSISLSCNDEDVSTFTNTYDFTVKQEFGQLISLMKDTCCRAFDNWPFKRLVHAMYRCEIECPYDTVGKLFPIIGRRQGKIIAEEIAGIDRIIIVALIPIVESFGFVSEVWAETSGSAMPQLMFDRWEILDEDPQYHNLQETTQISPYNFRLATVGGASCSSVTNNNYICDEEDESSLLSSKNRAQRYVNAVRKRKGLKIKEITVKFAEKQRTLVNGDINCKTSGSIYIHECPNCSPSTWDSPERAYMQTIG